MGQTYSAEDDARIEDIKMWMKTKMTKQEELDKKQAELQSREEEQASKGRKLALREEN
jgi:hypothetical protein